MMLGYISSASSLQGRRITLIVVTVCFLIVWDVLWISFSEIYEYEDSNKTLLETNSSNFYYS
jgi:hypothetical protein